MYDEIVVVGNGKTSRENVEALIDDYLYANPKVHVILYSVTRLSEGQIWLKQYLEFRGISHRSYLGDLPKDDIKSDNVAMFILWDDADVDSQPLLDVANENGWPAFDLTNGLHQINAVNAVMTVEKRDTPEPKKVVEPVVEASKEVAPKKSINATEVMDALEESAELQKAVQVIARIIAKEVKKALSE